MKIRKRIIQDLEVQMINWKETEEDMIQESIENGMQKGQENYRNQKQ